MKLTPFARFMLVMIFAAPLAFLAASYYNGEDGIQKMKELLGIEHRAKPAASESETAPPPAAPENVSENTVQQPAGAEDYAALKQENEDLRDLLSQKELEIQQLKKELNQLRAPKGQ